MRRTPILKNEALESFPHIGKQTSFDIKTPRSEELFANKFVTCIYRSTARDVYDANKIREIEFDREVFRKCLVLESLMEAKEPLTQLDVGERLSSVDMETNLRNMLRNNKKINFKRTKQKVINFTNKVLNELDSHDRNLITSFYDNNKFNKEHLVPRDIFHSQIENHPAIKWSLENIKS